MNATYPNRGLTALEEFSTDMERVFDSMLGRTVGSVLRGNNEKFVPTLDVSETPEAFQVQVDLAGVKPEDVKLEMHDGKLSISGHRVSNKEEKGKEYHRVERSSGAFFRAIALPSEVDLEKIDATYEHGVLMISLPKVAKQQPTKIEIRTNN